MSGSGKVIRAEVTGPLPKNDLSLSPVWSKRFSSTLRTRDRAWRQRAAFEGAAALRRCPTALRPRAQSLPPACPPRPCQAPTGWRRRAHLEALAKLVADDGCAVAVETVALKETDDEPGLLVPLGREVGRREVLVPSQCRRCQSYTDRRESGCCRWGGSCWQRLLVPQDGELDVAAESGVRPLNPPVCTHTPFALSSAPTHQDPRNPSDPSRACPSGERQDRTEQQAEGEGGRGAWQGGRQGGRKREAGGATDVPAPEPSRVRHVGVHVARWPGSRAAGSGAAGSGGRRAAGGGQRAAGSSGCGSSRSKQAAGGGGGGQGGHLAHHLRSR